MFKIHTLNHGVNELKHEAEQQDLVSLLEEGYEIVSATPLPDRIVYVLFSNNVRHNRKPDTEIQAIDGGVLKPGVKRTKTGTYYIPGKGFIKKEDAYV